MSTDSGSETASFSQDPKTGRLELSGRWNLLGMETVEHEMAALPEFKATSLSIDGKSITAMDSAGAWVIWQMVENFIQSGKKVALSGFHAEHQSLLHLVQQEAEKIQKLPAPAVKLSWIEKLGKKTLLAYAELIAFLTFFGEVIVTFWGAVRHPLAMQWRSFLNTIFETGYSALPIIALLNFLIGIVLAYQMGQQLKIYGANVYIVSLLGVGVLQEFAPLITAIIVAGRTSSAFTAQIGIMKINEEVDALQTMGLSPVNLLVLPKIAGLIVALPLLVIWADAFGILGGMIVSKRMLSINFYNFAHHFPDVIEMSTFLKGLLKAPFFAMIIALIGCFQGFSVSETGASVGWQTTKSVVQSIFLIIVADAIFSVIIPWQGV